MRTVSPSRKCWKIATVRADEDSTSTMSTGCASLFVSVMESTAVSPTGAALTHAVARSVEMKAEIVAEDEREAGRRALLNLGHTFGHALEAEMGFGEGLLHGEAVAFGMRAATVLATHAARLDAKEAEEIHRVIAKYGPIPPLHGISANNLANRLVSDKKTIQGNVHFVLPTKIGEVTVVSGVDDQLVLASIEAVLV